MGNVTRGFEVSTARLYKALAEVADLDVKLYTGGRYQDAKTVWNIPRDQVIKSPIGLLAQINERRVWEFSYGVEQISFGLFLWPELVSWKPDVVWTKEVPFGYFLLHYRNMFNLKFKVIFANGGAFRPQTYKDFDYIQHLQNDSYTEAQQYGIADEKMTVLTNFIDIYPSDKPRAVLRSQIGCSDDDWIVVCVSAWNRHHKRIDYLIDEVAQMNNQRVQLVMCGHPEPDTPVLKKMAQEKLPNRVHWLTLGQREVQEVLQAADVYVLPSINEALGNSMIEAALTGVPIITHEHSASKFLLQEPHRMTDLSQSGNLCKRLGEIMQSPPPEEEIAAIRERARSLFSREALMPRYCDMVKLVAGMPPFPKNSPRSTVGNYDFRAEN